MRIFTNIVIAILIVIVAFVLFLTLARLFNRKCIKWNSKTKRPSLCWVKVEVSK
jgi:uncharacterized protein YneF (UPF0154 family)